MTNHSRKPLVLANWKMAMTISESRAFISRFTHLADAYLISVDVILCPPYTAIYALAQLPIHAGIALGGQDISIHEDPSHTGEISAPLLKDAGCTWVMLGHWESRRRSNEDDAVVNKKIHLAFGAGLKPVVLFGESTTDASQAGLNSRLEVLLHGLTPEQAGEFAFVYEPESHIGGSRPVTPDHAAAGCRLIRSYITDQFGPAASQRVRIIYGGSVAPEWAQDLASSEDIDGLGAGRKGRSPEDFAEIVRLVHWAKSQIT
jgi:triosephosphate isomerase (TIM)